MELLTRKAPPEAPPGERPRPRKAKPFRIELGWRGMFGLVVVCFFLFFWMFVLGIWAGQTILFPPREQKAPPAVEQVAPLPGQAASGNTSTRQSPQLKQPE